MFLGTYLKLIEKVFVVVLVLAFGLFGLLLISCDPQQMHLGGHEADSLGIANWKYGKKKLDLLWCLCICLPVDCFYFETGNHSVT